MTTGVNSNFPITRLASKYMQMQRDGELLSTRNSIAIVRKRIEQLAERIDLNEAPDRMARIGKLWKEYTQALDQADNTEQLMLRMDIDSEFEKAFHDYAAWQQMFDALDLDRKMVESEVKIIERIKAIMTAEDAYELVAKLQAAVMKVIDDPKKLKQVQYEFARLIGETSDSVAERVEPDARGSSRQTIDI